MGSLRNFRKNVNSVIIRAAILLKKKDGFGMNEILGIAAGLILAAFIIIPGLKDVSKKIIDDVKLWWDSTVSKGLFPTSLN